MNQKEPTKTNMMITDWQKPFDLHDFYNNFQRFKGNMFYLPIRALLLGMKLCLNIWIYECLVSK